MKLFKKYDPQNLESRQPWRRNRTSSLTDVLLWRLKLGDLKTITIINFSGQRFGIFNVVVNRYVELQPLQ
jgi:hypothetical protein